MNKTKNWRKPAGKNSKFTCATIIGKGKNIIKGKFGFEEINYGKKNAPLSSDLREGMVIVATVGGNPNRQEVR